MALAIAVVGAVAALCQLLKYTHSIYTQVSQFSTSFCSATQQLDAWDVRIKAMTSLATSIDITGDPKQSSLLHLLQKSQDEIVPLRSLVDSLQRQQGHAGARKWFKALYHIASKGKEIDRRIIGIMPLLETVDRCSMKYVRTLNTL